MNSSPTLIRILIAFLIAVVVATVWGSIVQTQFNLAALHSLGVEIGAGVNARTVFRDLFSGFFPTYGGYIVLPALLVAFAIAGWIVGRGWGSSYLWFGVAGFAALLLAIPLVNWLAPVALLVGASRDVSCTILMALGGALAGFLFVSMVLRRHSPSV